VSSRRLEVSWEDPAALAAEGMKRPALDFLSAIRDGELPTAPISRLLGFDLVEVEEGRAVFAADPGEQHYNPIGVVHAGLAATMLDSAMGCAVHSALPEGSGYTTLETKFNLVRSITAETGRIEAGGKVVNLGRRVGTAEGRLVAASSGKLLAHGTSTCLVVELP
jgi:uncharacterized protein (TIGR00369 family)